MKTVYDNGGYLGVVADIADLSWLPKYTTTGLVLSLDAGYAKSYSGGAQWNDTGPANLSATLNNTSYSSTAGGGSFGFNGTNSSATIPNNTVMDSQSITVEVWGRTSNIQQAGFWMEKGTVNSQYSIFLYGGYIYWRVWNVADTTVGASSFLTNNAWFHVVGTTTSGAQRLYVNSVERATNSGTAAIPTSTAGFSVGNANGVNASSYPYLGDISIVRVYNRALTSSEVALNFNNYRSRFGL